MRFRFKPTLTWSLLILLAAAMFIPVPYVMKSPGPVFNTIGKIKDVELITNNQAKVDAIVKSGRSVQVIAVAPAVNQFNRPYLLTKKDKMKHMLGEI